MRKREKRVWELTKRQAEERGISGGEHARAVEEARLEGRSVPPWVLLDYPELMSLANPLGYFCAPNGATPDYVACTRLRDFIAYGLATCYVDPEDTAMEYTGEDLYWAREDFLDTLAMAAANYSEFDPNRQIWERSEGGFYVHKKGAALNHWGEYDCDDECYVEWAVCMRDVGSRLAYDFGPTLALAWGWQGCDDTAIWIYTSALRNKSGVRYWLTLARAVNRALRGRFIPGASDEPEWSRLESAGQRRLPLAA